MLPILTIEQKFPTKQKQQNQLASRAVQAKFC